MGRHRIFMRDMLAHASNFSSQRFARRCEPCRYGYNARVNSAQTPFAQLHAALQSGEITPLDAVEQHLARANSNSGHNVYIAIDRERALRDADEVTRRFAGRAKPRSTACLFR